MPQPLSRVAPNANILLGNAGDRPIARHPDLAILAMEALVSWCNVEGFMLQLFVELFGGHGALAVEVFLSLQNQSAKSAAIDAAAQKVLGARVDELRVLRAILAIAKTNEKERNKLAHWTWGDSPEIPDGLLLVDPRAIIGDYDRASVFVYKPQDFVSIIRANDRLCDFGLQLKFVLSRHGANRDGRLLGALLAEPEIQQRLPPAQPE
jgi:hypothetical protein